MGDSLRSQAVAVTDPAGVAAVVVSASSVAAPRARGWARRGAAVRRVLTACVALWMFLVALGVMKSGAQALAPALEGSVFTDSLASTLGFGWLGSMLVMSGSPIAASSLALLDGGSVSAEGAFAMLTGSRFGAAFVVLLVAAIYALRGHAVGQARRASLSIGVLSLLLTAVAYLPGAVIGLALLRSDALAGVPAAAPPAMLDLINAVSGPAVTAIKAAVPAGGLFLVGLVVLLTSLRLLDLALPQMKASDLEEHAGWRSRRWVMFGIGAAVAFVTMSVSVALTVLVPAVAKGYIRREHAIAYIAGANVTTLADTLVTALILGNPVAAHVVLAELIGVGVVTLALVAFGYPRLSRSAIASTDWILESRTRLIGFVGVLFATPLALVFGL